MRRLGNRPASVGGLFHFDLVRHPGEPGFLPAFSSSNEESVMGLAEYMIIAQGEEWGVLHDGDISNRYATKEAAFEAAVAAASLAIREGHEVRLSVPDRSAGNKTALGAKS